MIGLYTRLTSVVNYFMNINKYNKFNMINSPLVIPSPTSLVPPQVRNLLETKQLILVAVCKKQSDSKVLDAVKTGYIHFGENTLPGLTRTSQLLQTFPNTHTHFIGRLQSNKVKKICLLSPLMIHSVTQLSHLQILARLQQEGVVIPQLLLQVNCANTPNQEGLPPKLELIEDALKQFSSLPWAGLMTMGAAPKNYPDHAQWTQATQIAFAQLAKIRQSLQGRGLQQVQHLSMGMSEDFEIAIQEGATIIRLGSRIFGHRGPL